MAINTNFKQQLKEGQPLIGTLQTLSAPEVTEIIALAGFDWIWVDLEHSTINVAGAQKILQAAASRCPCLVRVPSHDEMWIKQVLDIGADGIIVPQVKTAEEAEHIMRCAYYPPQGARSVGLARAHDYGQSFGQYVKEANQHISVILQIEHIDGVNNIEAIAKVPGIDALVVGPYDLSGSLGKIGQVDDPEVVEAIKQVRQTCENQNIPAGIFTADPQKVPGLIEQGFSLIAVGIDTMMFSQTLRQALDTIKNQLDIHEG